MKVKNRHVPAWQILLAGLIGSFIVLWLVVLFFSIITMHFSEVANPGTLLLIIWSAHSKAWSVAPFYQLMMCAVSGITLFAVGKATRMWIMAAVFGGIVALIAYFLNAPRADPLTIADVVATAATPVTIVLVEYLLHRRMHLTVSESVPVSATQ